MTLGRAGVVVLLGLAVVLAGCATYRRADLPTPSADFLRQPDPLFADNYDYRLGPSDLVTISVYRAPEFSGDYRVDTAGQIMVPLLGLVPVQGMTALELAEDFRERLGNRYYVNPDVSVALKESNSQRFAIDGAVRNAGIYAMPGRMTLMEAIARAGGASGSANLRRVAIFRQIDGQRMVAAFDLFSIQQSQAEDPQVYASDIIVVDGSQTKQVLRDVLMTLPVIGLFRPFFY